ncbi:IS66 family transposase [Nodularia sp. LEGE 06071]|nr:IS66 family transposase [Nodularia sp. LEGE 06071]
MAENNALKIKEAEQLKINEEQAIRITLLELQVTELRKFIFGGKQEKFKPAANTNALQPDLFPDDKLAEVIQTTTLETKEVSTKNKSIRVNHKGRNPLPTHIRREEIIIQPSEDVTGLIPVGQQITEVLEYKVGELYIKKYIRPEYIKPTEENTTAKRVIASLPSMPIDKCIAGPSLLAYLMVSKFMDHLPIHRLLQIFLRQKVILDATTVSGWLRAAGQLIEPLYDALRQEVLSTPSLGIDETPLKVIDRNKKGTTHQGYYWVYYNTLNKLVIFKYEPGRDGQCPRDILSGYKGHIHVDGYSAYTQFENTDDIIVSNCWAHVRRKFIDVQSFDKDKASEVLEFIAQLYGIEKHCRENNLNEGQIKEVRQAESIPVLQALQIVLKNQQATSIPDSPLGKALNYTLKRWSKLTVYTQEGYLPIDNNLVENSIRPVAIGRRNWLFAGSHEAAQRSAMLYSLFATCKLHNIEPITWLTEVLFIIKDHPINKIKDLLPQNYYSKSA